MQEQERKQQRRDSAEDSESEGESENGFEGAAGDRADQHSQGIGEVEDRIGRTEARAMTALANGSDLGESGRDQKGARHGENPQRDSFAAPGSRQGDQGERQDARGQ